MEQPRGESGQYITLREFVTTLIDERTRAHAREHELTSHGLERAERLRNEAVEQALEVIDARLEKLNELRREVIHDRGQYITRTEFDLQINPLQRFKDKALGFGVLVAIASTVFGAVITALVMGLFG